MDYAEKYIYIQHESARNINNMEHKFFLLKSKVFFVFIFFYVMLSEYVTSKTAIQDERRWITKI